MPGRLARENAERQPQRTAITASALMIGLALVVFTAIFAAGLRGSIDKVIDEQLSRSALIVTHDDGFSPVPPGVADAARQTAGRRRRLADALRPGQRQGRRRLGPGHRASTRRRSRSCSSRRSRRATRRRSPSCATTRRSRPTSWAESHDFELGDTLAGDDAVGQAASATSSIGTYDNQVGMLGEYPRHERVDDEGLEPARRRVHPRRRQGRARRRSRRRRASRWPTSRSPRRRRWRSSRTSPADQVNQLLGLVYALLSLSVIVALLGHRQHARAGRARAHARARAAARGRHEQAPGAADGARRVRDHGADRRRARARARDRVRRRRLAAAGRRGLRADVPGRRRWSC